MISRHTFQRTSKKNCSFFWAISSFSGLRISFALLPRINRSLLQSQSIWWNSFSKNIFHPLKTFALECVLPKKFPFYCYHFWMLDCSSSAEQAHSHCLPFQLNSFDKIWPFYGATKYNFNHIVTQLSQRKINIYPIV